MVRFSVLALAIIMAGCSAQPPKVMYVPQRVEVPVPYRLPAPQELAYPYRPDPLPRFISPSDRSAAAALSEEDLNHLKTILRTLHTRDAAWRAWASDGAPK